MKLSRFLCMMFAVAVLSAACQKEKPEEPAPGLETTDQDPLRGTGWISKAGVGVDLNGVSGILPATSYIYFLDGGVCYLHVIIDQNDALLSVWPIGYATNGSYSVQASPGSTVKDFTCTFGGTISAVLKGQITPGKKSFTVRSSGDKTLYKTNSDIVFTRI